MFLLFYVISFIFLISKGDTNKNNTNNIFEMIFSPTLTSVVQADLLWDDEICFFLFQYKLQCHEFDYILNKY